MTANIQLLILAISFLYGITFFLTSKYTLLITNKLPTIKKFLVHLIYVIDMVLIYIYIIYKINDGIFHIYNLILFIIGFLLIGKYYKNIVYICQKIKKNRKN